MKSNRSALLSIFRLLVFIPGPTSEQELQPGVVANKNTQYEKAIEHLQKKKPGPRAFRMRSSRLLLRSG